MKRPFIILGAGIIAFIALYFSWYLWIGPHLHNQVLNDFSNQLFAIEVPRQTMLLDTVSVVGHQIGNGDHCDYLAAVLLQTALPKTEFKQYYSENYQGGSEIQYIWLNKENAYTSTNFNPLTIFTLKEWIGEKLENHPSNVVVYIFEAGMTSALDYRCS